MGRNSLVMNVEGVMERVPFTTEEEAVWDAADAVTLAAAPRRNAIQEISRLEATITPRRIREALTDNSWVLAQEALIQAQRDLL